MTAMTDTPAAQPPKMTPGRIAGWIAAAILLGNGLVMMLAPSLWYAATPGVAETGPLNVHFVRDIGAAYLAVAAAVGMVLRGIGSRRALLMVAGIFMIGHAAFHLIDMLVGHGNHGAGLALEILGVYLPALIFLPVFLPRFNILNAPKLPAPLLNAMIAQGEKRLGVKLDYMRLVGETAPHILQRLGRVSQMAADPALNAAPKDAAHLAMIGATQEEDCGECLQIHVNLALADEMPPSLLRAALDGNDAGMTQPQVAAYRFGRAVASHAPDTDDWRQRVEQAFGKRAAMELAYMAAWAHFYPAFKRGIGVAQACSAVRVRLAA